ncbi:MAG: hypothetical protein COB93_11835 [Sneathiella sp.]|nr:MAG: hypothetical protein COB93_11835 [Sneathiella sp.]
MSQELTRRHRELTGRHVAMMLAGFFGVMFAVNAVFVYFALGSFSGLSVDEAYQRGLTYNQELARSEDQDARHWQQELVFVQTGDDAGTLTLKLMNDAGRKLEDITLSGTLRRPVVDIGDSPVEFRYTDGGYAADLLFAKKGQWDVVILVEGGGFDVPYRLEKRIWVK